MAPEQGPVKTMQKSDTCSLPGKASEKLPVAWVCTLPRADIEGMLTGLGIDATGTLDELRKTFRGYLKDKGVTDVDDQEVVSSLTCDRVRKWGLQFDGIGNAISLLERIKELQNVIRSLMEKC